MSYSEAQYQEDNQALNNFLLKSLDSSFIYSDKVITIDKLDFKVYNLKVKNFKQNIGFITFASNLKDLDNIYIILKDFVLKQGLKNYIIYIYITSKAIYTLYGFRQKLNNTFKVLESFEILKQFKAICLLEGYKFQENTSKLSYFK
jgi:hypothetical protein